MTEAITNQEAHEIKAASKIWTFDYVKLLLVAFMSSTSTQMIATGLPLWWVGIGGTTTQAGFAAAAYSCSVILVRPLTGRLCDVRGKWVMVIFGILSFFFGSVGISLLSVFFLILIFRFMHGIGFSFVSTATAAINMDVLPANRIHEGIGYYSVIKSLAYTFAPALVVVIYDALGGKSVFLITVLLCVLMFILTISIKSEKMRVSPVKKSVEMDSDQKKEKMNQDVGSDDYEGIWKFIEKKSIGVAFVQFFVTFASASCTTYLALYAIELGIQGFGMYFTIVAISTLVARLFVGKLTDKYGPMKLFIPGMILLVITYCGVSVAKTYTQFMILAVFSGLGSSTVIPLLNAEAMASAKPNRRGVASATYFTAIDFGNGGGAAIWGFLIPVLGYSGVYRVSTVIMAIAFGLGLIYFNKVMKAKKVLANEV